MKKLLVTPSFLCLNIAISPAKMFHNTLFDLSLLLGFVLNFILIIIFIHKLKEHEKSYTILLFAILGVSIVALPLHIAHFKATLGSLLSYTINLIALFGGYRYTKLKTKRSIYLFSFIAILFIILSSTWIANIWGEFVLTIID